jgi:uncharacterized membrane protein YphA (DoxX/SURF4 family)
VRGERAVKAKTSAKSAKPAARPATRTGRLVLAWFEPELIIRLEILRFFAPLAILGFLSSRIAYTDQWISEDGFCLPDLGTQDVHDAVYLPPIPGWAAWSVAALLVLCGLSVSAGFKTRLSAGAFAVLLAYVAMADRLAAFTVNRIAPMVALVICLSPAGTRFSVDEWLARRRLKGEAGGPRIEWAAGGTIRFFQAFLVVFYTASGICKARGDWLKHPAVLWTHLHDSYQTAFTLLLANSLPSFMWTVFQALTLAFECGALVWLVPRRLRPFGLGFALGMHLLIGLMFGPVLWFSLLMMTLLAASYLPDRLLERLASKLAAYSGL